VGPVGAGHFSSALFVNGENRFFIIILLRWSLQQKLCRTDGTALLKVKLSCSFGARAAKTHGSFEHALQRCLYGRA